MHRRLNGIGALIVTVVVAAAAPAAVAQDVDSGQVGGSWRAHLNRTVAEHNHWRWILRYVERNGDTLTVGLDYKNVASTGRPLLLAADYMTAIALENRTTAERFPLIEVEGISAEATPVERHETRRARFVFAYPKGAEAVRFDSKWISMRMGGEASVAEVGFSIAIPPPEARRI
jgi:hypothetical protein